MNKELFLFFIKFQLLKAYQTTYNCIAGTRTVPVPGSEEPNIQGTRTRTVPVLGRGEPNVQGARTEWFWYPSVI